MTTLLNNQGLVTSEIGMTSAGAPVLAGVVEAECSVAPMETLRLEKLLVAVDFSSGSLGTLNYATALARRFGSLVSLLHVVERESFMSGLRDVSVVLDEWGAEHGVRERLDQWMQHKIWPAMQGESLVRRGKVVQQIVEAAHDTDADLIVMGRAHRRGWERWLAPRRLKRAVRQARCPILIVPEHFLSRHPEAVANAATGPGRNILVPVDGSRLSQSALKWGASLVDPTRGSLSVFYVPNLYETPSGNRGGERYQLRAHTTEAREERLWAWARETVPAHVKMNVLREVGVRDAEVLALRAVRECCDLIVLYSRGGSRRQRLLDGSLAEEVAGMASCAVLCLPEPATDGIKSAPDTPWWGRLIRAHLKVPREDDRTNR